MTERILDWDGNYNVRDLGGLEARGGVTRYRAFIRSAAAFQFTATGWAAAHAYGVRTVIDLMNPGEYREDAGPRPADIATLRVPLDNQDDREFWDPLVANGHWGTALYYRAFLQRYPETVGAVITAMAGAAPGGVLFHCGRGQDRTGLIAMVLLALAGVDADRIADDYELCASPETVRLRAEFGEPDDREVVRAILERAGTTNRDAIAAALASIDVDDYLGAAGVGGAERNAIRRRLT